jgi:hypothetical protein
MVHSVFSFALALPFFFNSNSFSVLNLALFDRNLKSAIATFLFLTPDLTTHQKYMACFNLFILQYCLQFIILFSFTSIIKIRSRLTLLLSVFPMHECFYSFLLLNLIFNSNLLTLAFCLIGNGYSLIF